MNHCRQIHASYSNIFAQGPRQSLYERLRCVSVFTESKPLPPPEVTEAFWTPPCADLPPTYELGPKCGHGPMRSYRYRSVGNSPINTQNSGWS